jgi:cold shock CspA family protein
MIGTVSKYDRIAGIGWIVPKDPTLPDFFVIPKFIAADKHHRFLAAGQRVEFDPFDIEGKPQAHNVRVISQTIAVQCSASITRDRR